MSEPAGIKKKFATSAATMSVARTVEQIAIFVRNLILANALGAENQGVAATFAIAMTFFEMLSDFAVSRLLIQADDGDDPRLQRSAHAFEVGRGLLSGLILFAAAAPIASFFKASEAVWAFQLIALVPFIKGLEHLDIHRIKRALRFSRYLWYTLVPQLVMTAIAYPLARATGDYSAWAYLLLVQAVAGTLVSHLLAERPYRIGMHREHARRIFAFGTPLMINGFVYFAVLNGDRTAVARNYTKEELGIYANVLMLTMMAGRFTMSIVSPLVLPVLSQVKNDPVRFERRCRRLSQLSAASVSFVALGFILAGPSLLEVLYIEEYWPGAAFIGLLGVAASIRSMRVLTNGAQMARADNMAVLYSNMVRLIGVGLAFWAASRGMSLVVIAWCAVIGETLAMIASAWLLQTRQALSAIVMLGPPVAVVAAAVVAAGIVTLPLDTGWPRVDLVIGGAIAALLGLGVTAMQPALREEFAGARVALARRLGARRGTVA